VLAVGCADGKIHVHNIRYDEEIVTFSHSMRGAVTALSFSTGRNLSSDAAFANFIHAMFPLIN